MTTDHLVDGLWFREMEDFKVGMNYVAVQASRSRVVVLAFILMSNHVHFVLYGTREDVLAFIYGFKTRYSRYLQRKYGLPEFLRDYGVDLQEIPEDDGQDGLVPERGQLRLACPESPLRLGGVDQKVIHPLRCAV